MPKPPLPADIDEFLAHPNPSVIAAIRPDGSPHTAATWYLWESGRVLVNMDEGRRRLGYIRNNPQVSITVMGENSWYRQVTLLGVASLDPDPQYQDIDRISRHYTGNPYPDHEHGRVSAWIEVEAWYGWAGSGFWVD